MKRELLQLWNLSTTNRYQEKVKRVNLLVRQGECHLLWGKDYTGRTLAGIFRGGVTITEGKILVKKEEIQRCSQDIFEQGKIFYVDSDTRFMKSLDLAENLFLLKKNSLKKLWINESAIHTQADSLLKSYGFEYRADSRVGSLSVADRVMISIVRAAGQGAELFVLNNLSAECSSEDFSMLKNLLKRLREQGKALLIYDSHAEWFTDIADHIVVTNHGEIIKKIIDKEELEKNIDALIKKTNTDRESLKASESEEKILGGEIRFEGLCLNGTDIFSIAVKEREIVYLANTNAAEQAKLWNCLLGMSADRPKVRIDGREIPYRDSGELARRRIGFWGGGKGSGEILTNLSVKDNILLPSLRRISKLGWYRSGADYIFRDNLIADESFWDKEKKALTDSSNLSENDVLKTILYKWKLYHPRVLIVNNILSKADVWMKEWLTDQFLDMAKRGTAIILMEMTEADAKKIADRTLTLNVRGVRLL